MNAFDGPRPGELGRRGHGHGAPKVAVVAFACVPDAGSEQGGGWAWARAAAVEHDVWLFTDEANRVAIEAARAAEPALRLHPVYLAQTRWIRVHAYGPRFIRVRYLLWLRRAAAAVRLLHAQVGFDVTHHLTYSNDWLPVGVPADVEAPLVWGPVGGAPPFDARALRWLGPRGGAIELVRTAGTSLARRLFAGRNGRRAAVVLAQNPAVATRVRTTAAVLVEPQLAVDRSEAVAALRSRGEPVIPAEDASSGPLRQTDATGSRRRVAVFAGRLLAWKGVAIGLEALTMAPAANWELHVYGEGRDRRRLERKAARLGLGERVRFLGRRPRSEVLEALCRADALLMPSLADAAGWIVAEAVSVGCPVVCIDRGGPPWIIREGGGEAVPLARATPRLVAEALQRTGPATRPSARWSADRLPALLRRVYGQAALAPPPARRRAAVKSPVTV
jgi:glycosyltransferase involved in cell wall biosynthesis